MGGWLGAAGSVSVGQGPPALLEIPVPLSRRSREGNGLCKGREEAAGKGDQVQWNTHDYQLLPRARCTVGGFTPVTKEFSLSYDDSLFTDGETEA